MDNKKEQQITIFGKKIVVSPQARLAFWGYVIVLLCMIAMSLLSTGMGWMTPVGIFVGILSLAFLVAYMLFGLYILNCTVTGGCEVLAWILTAIALFTAAVYLTILLASLFGAASKGRK